ncbi:MAG: helix-turn-helix domain-containing protein, partial [Pseudomonadota bacterium]
MSNNTFLSSFWEGFQVIQSHKTDSLITITLRPDSTAMCPCGRPSDSIHDYQWRVLKEAMMFDIPVELSVQTRRVNCPDCGVRTEVISWISPYARITNRLKGYIEKLLPLLPIKHISELTGVHWHTIKE